MHHHLHGGASDQNAKHLQTDYIIDTKNKLTKLKLKVIKREDAKKSKFKMYI